MWSGSGCVCGMWNAITCITVAVVICQGLPGTGDGVSSERRRRRVISGVYRGTGISSLDYVKCVYKGWVTLPDQSAYAISNSSKSVFRRPLLLTPDILSAVLCHLSTFEHSP